MTLLPQLRGSLVHAAERSRVPAARAGRRGRREVRLGGLARAVPAMVLACLTVGIGALALTSFHHRTDVGGRQPAGAAKLTVTDRQLLQAVAVLRRPQTALDRKIYRQSRLASLGQGPGILGVQVDPASARLATITPWGTRVLLFLAVPRSAQQRPAKPKASYQLMRVPSLASGGLGVEEQHGFGCCTTASVLRQDGSESEHGWGRSFAGGSSGFRLYVVVPDGVAKVTFVLPRNSNPGQYGAPIYSRALRVTVPVHGNVAAIEEAHRQCCGGSVAELWYSAGGKVIHTVGNPAAASRVTAAPKPGPVTARSRAAVQNPSAPNRVWVMPEVGRPRTNFRIHFRVLLNGADYAYKFTGPSCPSFAFAGGTGDPNALRGSLWDGDVSGIQGQALCPGTYHVSVSVMDLGASSTRTLRIRPFGSATFTVKP